MLKNLMLALVVSNVLVASAMADDANNRRNAEPVTQPAPLSDAQRQAADEYAGKAIAANQQDYRNH